MSKPNKCFYCPASTDQNIKLEEHHVLGRINSGICVLACLNCHNQITSTQNSLSPKTRSKNALEIEKILYQEISEGAHLKLLGEEKIKIAKERLEFYKQNGYSIR